MICIINTLEVFSLLYTCQNPILEIQTVGRFAWEPRSLSVQARPYSALAFRLEGGGTLRCGDKSYTLSSGDVLYMPQGISYSHQYTKTDLLLFHFTASYNDPEPEIYHLKNPQEIERLFRKAMELWEDKSPGYTGKCLSILYKILGLLAENEAQNRLPEHFNQAVEILHQAYRNSDLRIGDVCSAAGMGQTAFRELMRQHFGKTPVAYVTELRLEYARGLIAEGTSVETAALTSGFTDVKYFARVVKRHYGCTPRQLRLYGNM